MSNAKAKDKAASVYKDTVNLPKTDFPMKADLVTREPVRLAAWEQGRLYHRIQEKRKAAASPKFVLHDGPPFANGDAHMGTALNKVLKDLVVKSKTMAGFETPFIPGWDCHGLPIEFKVVKEAADLAPAEIRSRSEKFARSWIEVQKGSFKRLGVFADWDHPYLTLAGSYEAAIMRFFGTCVEKNLVYRAKRPVQWSYGAQTALAEAEVEYKEKVSPAIFVPFNAGDFNFVIWTTTPWTLPANLGIAVHPEFTYYVADFAKEGVTTRLVLAKSLVGQFQEKTGWHLVVGTEVEKKGLEFVGLEAQHPFLARTSKVIPGTFVTDDTGTGQVHIAPGHGMEDYIAGKENGLGLLSPVDNLGKLTEECGLPQLVGTHVFDANKPIIALLAEKGRLLGQEKHFHSYPHCWRSKTPIIFRSVEQFFLSVDAIRSQALAEIDKTEWLPHWGRNRIFGTVESRPDWCISRQRTWGVPLPVFYDSKGELIMSADLARKVADLVSNKGTNYWFTATDAELAAELGLPAGASKGKDTLDVWIDSGCSHFAVTQLHPELASTGGVADLYLEATDQHRGWFQSSLMCSVIHRGKAPYKTVMTHGFVTDTSGDKISKSGDKPINVEHFYNKYGADMVRLWVASVNWQSDVPFGTELFEQTGDTYRRIRNTFRILLGNLSGFAPDQALADAELTLLDRWLLERLHVVTKECLEAYASYEFRKVFNTLNNFCAVDLSALYVDITKDRMYCDALTSTRRRSAQTAMHTVLHSLCRLAAPILAFTADEAWESLGEQESVHLAQFPSPNPAFADGAATAAVEQLQGIRAVLQQEVEKARQEKLIGSNIEAAVTFAAPAGEMSDLLTNHRTDAAEFLILSDYELLCGEVLTAKVTKSSHGKCERCWRHLPEVGSFEKHPTLCGRCHGVLS
jgi:isoleucyl-tRNA synthetase